MWLNFMLSVCEVEQMKINHNFFFFNLFQVNSIHVTLEMMSYLVVLDINLCLSTQYLWNFIGNLLIISYCFILSGMCLLCVSVPTASCSALFLMNKWYILLGFHTCRSTKAWQFFFFGNSPGPILAIMIYEKRIRNIVTRGLQFLNWKKVHYVKKVIFISFLFDESMHHTGFANSRRCKLQC